MSESYVVPDKNLQVEANVTHDGIRFFDVREAPFCVYGLYDYKRESIFKRMPSEVAEKVSNTVSILYTNTAGGRVRFSTNSRYISIRTKERNATAFSHMTFMGIAGFDLYVDKANDLPKGYYASFIPPMNAHDGYESKVDLGSRAPRSFTVNFPSYCDVISLEIGVEADADLCKGEEYANKLPVVFYGSSITQGGCSSRPGNTYQNIISRRLGIGYINLGFSGGCKAEKAMAEYLSTLKMSTFVCDYDHNAPSPAYLRETHFPLYEKIRSKNPDLPYVMISLPGYRNNATAEERRRIIIDSFERALALGDTNVYFIDGRDFFKEPYEDICTVDRCHPNDLGFALMADKIGAVLKTILNR